MESKCFTCQVCKYTFEDNMRAPRFEELCKECAEIIRLDFGDRESK